MSRRCDREGKPWDDRLTIGEHTYTKNGLPCDALMLMWEIRSTFGRQPKDHETMMAHLRERPSLPPFPVRAMRHDLPPPPLPEWLARTARFLARVDGFDVRDDETVWMNYEIG